MVFFKDNSVHGVISFKTVLSIYSTSPRCFLHKRAYLINCHSDSVGQFFVRRTCLCVCVVAQSCPTLCNPLDVACQVPLSMDFPGKNIEVGCHFPRSRDLPNPGIEPTSPALAGRPHLSHQKSPKNTLGPHKSPLCFCNGSFNAPPYRHHKAPSGPGASSGNWTIVSRLTGQD